MAEPAPAAPLLPAGMAGYLVLCFGVRFSLGLRVAKAGLMHEHQLPALCTVHPSRCCTAAALHPPGCPHAASLLLEPFSRQPAASSADVMETRAGRCRQPLPKPSPNLPTKLWDSRLVQILERMRRSKGCKWVWYGKPAPTEAYGPLKELRANKRGAGEGFPSSRCRAPSIRPCKDSAGWHWPSDGAHFPQGPVSTKETSRCLRTPQRPHVVLREKLSTRLGTAMAKAPTLPFCPCPRAAGRAALRGTGCTRDYLLFIPHHILGCMGAIPALSCTIYRVHVFPAQKKAKIG